jgi:HAD superfamily hydrolase (TIGR01549 family)
VRDCVLLDVDGTLVDSNYQHALAWYRAFRRYDLVLPLWRIHQRLGMGGDRLVPDLVGPELDRDRGEGIRSAWKQGYDAMIGEVAALQGATELLAEARELGVTVVLASSGKPDHMEHYLDLLDARDLVDVWTSSGDVDATKPAPDLLEVALEKAGGRDALAVGDSPFDAEAAVRIGVPCVAVRTGGFSADGLRAAGAAEVLDDLGELRLRLPEVLGKR